MKQKEPALMTVSEVAEYLRVARPTIYNLLRKKMLPAFRIGADYRFHRDLGTMACGARVETRNAEALIRPALLTTAGCGTSASGPLASRLWMGRDHAAVSMDHRLRF